MGSTLKWIPRLSGLAFILNCEWFAIAAYQFDIATPQMPLNVLIHFSIWKGKI